MKPLNRQIKDFIQSRIDDGQWKTGDRIPSEAELASRFDASRMTVNRAVKELAEAGHLKRMQGLGTFVAPRVAQAPLFDIQSIRKDIVDRGQEHHCLTLALDRARLDSENAHLLALSPGVEVYYLEAVHSADGRPIQLEKRFVNPGLAPDFINQDFSTVTASEYLLKHVPFTEVEHTVDAVSVDEAMAGHLQLPLGTPCLRLTRRTLLRQAVITRVELIHPGDQFKLSGRFPGNTAAAQVA